MRYREALSARMDGEDEPGAPALADAHRAQCEACRQWQEQAVTATRMVRLWPLHHAPLPAERLLAGFSPAAVAPAPAAPAAAGASPASGGASPASGGASPAAGGRAGLSRPRLVLG